MVTQLEKQIRQEQEIYDRVIAGGRPEYNPDSDPEVLAWREVAQWVRFGGISLGGTILNMVSLGWLKSYLDAKYPRIADSYCNPTIVFVEFGIVALAVYHSFLKPLLPKKQK